MTEPTQDGLGPLFNAPDAGNQGPGEVLRRAREAQRISIEVMAANIKVSVSKLQALEAGRFDQLPDANFTRALAMTLCRVLKVEAAPVLAALPAARPATLVSEVPSLNQPFKASRASMALFDRSVNWTAILKPQWLAPLALLLAAGVLYLAPGSSDWPAQAQAWWHSQHTSTAASTEAASGVDAAVLPPPVLPSDVMASDIAAEASAASAPAVHPNGARPLTLDAADAASGALPPVLPSSAVTPPPSVPMNPVAPVAPTAPTSPAAHLTLTPPAPGPATSSLTPNGLLSMRAREATWVEVKDAQGVRLLGRLIQRDETVDLSVPPPLTLRVGNAAGLTLSFKGKVIDLVPHTRNNIARLELK